MSLVRPPTPDEVAHLKVLHALGPAATTKLDDGLPEQFPEGLSSVKTHPKDHDLGHIPSRPPSNLNDLTSEFVLFQHATLMILGGLQQDPVALYWAESNLPIKDRPRQIQLLAPIVIGPIPGGLANEFHYIYACPLQYWSGLSLSLSLVSGIGNGRYWDSLRQDLNICAITDISCPQVWDRPEIVKASLYGIDGSDWLIYFLPSPEHKSGPIRLAVAPSTRKKGDKR